MSDILVWALGIGSIALLFVIVVLAWNRRLANEVSARRQAEEALRESEEHFRVAQEVSPDGFTILRPVHGPRGRVIDFTWVYENDTIARISGTDPTAVVGRRLLDVFPGHAGTKFLKAYQQVAESGETCIFEDEYQGESIVDSTWFRIVVVPVGTDIAILAQDITQRKTAEQEREDAIKRLESALSEIKALRGVIPICSYCKKIRDDEGAWEQLEAYMMQHSIAQFSHGICPECVPVAMKDLKLGEE